MRGYRYRLTRQVGPLGEGTALWVMLNPSTATEFTDDPTIRKVKGFTARFGYSTALVVNLFAARATDPNTATQAMDDPVGLDNDWQIAKALNTPGRLLIIAAWGTKRALRGRVIGRTRSGARHARRTGTRVPTRQSDEGRPPSASAVRALSDGVRGSSSPVRVRGYRPDGRIRLLRRLRRGLVRIAAACSPTASTVAHEGSEPPGGLVPEVQAPETVLDSADTRSRSHSRRQRPGLAGRGSSSSGLWDAVVLTGSHRKPFRETCAGCGDELTGRQIRWCSKRGLYGGSLCNQAWNKPSWLWKRLLGDQDGICHICDKRIEATVGTRTRWDGSEYSWRQWDVEVDHVVPLC